MPTGDVDNTNSTNKGRDLLFANKADCSSRNINDGAKGPEKYESYYTLIKMSLKRAKRDEKFKYSVDYCYSLEKM